MITKSIILVPPCCRLLLFYTNVSAKMSDAGASSSKQNGRTEDEELEIDYSEIEEK